MSNRERQNCQPCANFGQYRRQRTSLRMPSSNHDMAERANGYQLSWTWCSYGVCDKPKKRHTTWRFQYPPRLASDPDSSSCAVDRIDLCRISLQPPLHSCQNKYTTTSVLLSGSTYHHLRSPVRFYIPSPPISSQVQHTITSVLLSGSIYHHLRSPLRINIPSPPFSCHVQDTITSVLLSGSRYHHLRSPVRFNIPSPPLSCQVQYTITSVLLTGSIYHHLRYPVRFNIPSPPFS